MRRGPAMFVAVCRAMTYAACLHVVFTTTAYASHGEHAWSSLPAWLVGAALCVAANMLLLERRPALPTVATANAVLAALQIALLVSLSPALPTTFSKIALGVTACVTTALSYQAAANPPSISKSLFAFDAFLVALVVHVALTEANPELGADLPSMLAVLMLDLAANVVLRGVEGRNGTTTLASPVRGMLFGVGAIVLIALVSLGLVQLVAFSADSAVSALWAGIQAAADMVWRAVVRMMTWLASVFGTDFEVAPTEPVPGVSDGADEMVELGTGGGLGHLGMALAIAAAIVALALVFKFRGRRLGGGEARRVGSAGKKARIERRRQSRLAQLIVEWRFQLTALRHRTTPAGQLVALERKAKRAGTPRLPGETIAEFLVRMAPDGSLSSIADALEQQHFAN